MFKPENHRIKQYPNGKFYVEKLVKPKSWFRSEKWECISFYYGTPEPFGFCTFDVALKLFLTQLKHNIIENSKT
jgi:hypothetical protein